MFTQQHEQGELCHCTPPCTTELDMAWVWSCHNEDFISLIII